MLFHPLPYVVATVNFHIKCIMQSSYVQITCCSVSGFFSTLTSLLRHRAWIVVIYLAKQHNKGYEDRSPTP